MNLRIVADGDIADAAAAFEAFGEIRLHDGRALHRALLADCDVLLVRSVTRVDANLLDGTPVRFVGTCTIGEDHVDKAWLAATGFDPVYGARPLKRLIQTTIEDALARRMLAGELHDGQTVTFDVDADGTGLVVRD